jgi:hypothetical protein
MIFPALLLAGLSVFASSVSGSNVRSLRDTVLFELPRRYTASGIDNILRWERLKTMPVELAHYMLEFGEYDYLEHYERLKEDSDCQEEMFKVRSGAKNPELDETLFHPLKLKTNWELLEKIFLERVVVDPTKPDAKEVVYHGDFFGERVPEEYFRDLYELAKGKGKVPVFMTVFKHVVQNQMKNMRGTLWLMYLLKVVDEEDKTELFTTVLDCGEMTPVILRIFLGEMNRITLDELYLGGGIDDTEKTLRCIVYAYSQVPVEPLRVACKGPFAAIGWENHEEFLNALAKSGRKDRALHSTMAYAKFIEFNDPDIDADLIDYSVLSLSDLTKSVREAAELAGMTLPPVLDVSKLPFKERFGHWLRGGQFVCSDEPPVSFKDVLKTIRIYPISINRKLSEPLFVVGSKVLTEEAAGQEGVKLTRVVDALIFASDQIGKGSNFKEEYRLEDSRVKELELAGLFAAFSEGRRINIAPGNWSSSIEPYFWGFVISIEEITIAVRKPDTVEELAAAMLKQKISEE